MNQIQTFDEYVALSAQTSPVEQIRKIVCQKHCNQAEPKYVALQHLDHGQLGLDTEIGELADVEKKMVYRGHALDRINLLEECGDIYWYLAEIHRAAKVLYPSHAIMLDAEQRSAWATDFKRGVLREVCIAGRRLSGQIDLVLHHGGEYNSAARYEINKMYGAHTYSMPYMIALMNRLIQDHDCTPQKVWQANLVKLRVVRYADGQFSAESSNARDVEAERKALEEILR